ncbi:MAG: hypothetical protein WBM71_12910 [Sedimenticolaceae bacterium]
MKSALSRFFRYSLASGLAGVVALVGLGGLNLYTYHRFTDETIVATLKFEALGEGSHRVTIAPVGRETRQMDLAGDEWQLDVRMIKWTDWLTFLGESPLYRLDRLSGRYIDIADARARGQTMYALTETPGIDVWAFARRAGDWLPGIDAAYGSSVYLPMGDGLSYVVSISPTGLLARKLEDGGRH